MVSKSFSFIWQPMVKNEKDEITKGKT